MSKLTINKIKNSIIKIRDEEVILDSFVADFYGTTTREINKAVKNNLDKFPKGYVFELDKKEKEGVVENFHNLSKLKFSPTNPKVFTEKGLYMLATILKSKKATETTLLIIETFSKIKKLQNDFNMILEESDENKKELIGAKFGKSLLNIFLNDTLEDKESETKIKFSMFGFSLEKSIKKGK